MARTFLSLSNISWSPDGLSGADDKSFFRLDLLKKSLPSPDIASRIDSLGVPIKRFGPLVSDRDVLDIAGAWMPEASEHAHKMLDIARAIF